jgi:hypothetical protein
MEKVTFRCGHTDEVRYLSTTGEQAQARRIARLEAGLCRACWLKEQLPLFWLRPDGGLVVSRGYSIRDELKARGYRWQRPTWRKRFGTEAERQLELAWVRESGFNVKGA